jgi:Cu(I)/Ag(I) efflux system membrane fusion protein
MSRLRAVTILALGVAAGALGGNWYAHRPVTNLPLLSASASAQLRTILYYRDAGGAPAWSATPRKDATGRDFVPVYDDEEPSFDGSKPKTQTPTATAKRILYYRNPMGLPDTSPVPKKDAMGMDYIPVYENEDRDPATLKVSLDKVQRSGVRTETVEARVLVRPIRAVGTVKIDERRLTIVAMRSDGYVEDLFVNTTGQTVQAGEPLFRIYSAEIQRAQIDLLVAMRSQGSTTLGPAGIEGAMQRLRNLGVPESRIREVRATGGNPRTIDWPAPANGTVIDKRVINGQRVAAGDELYRIADLSRMWVIADVAESDLAAVKPGTRAVVTFRAYAAQPVEGEVTFIYPQLRAETRTARVRIEVPNPDGQLKADMYADVVFRAGADQEPVVAVPDSAVIDSGTRRIVLVAKAGGRFEPRAVKLGGRGDGYVEILDGVNEGETVVTSAAFLIDAESNLKAALNAFSQPEAPK